MGIASALAKRRQHAGRGWPLGALRVCICVITRRGRVDCHAVLHAVTDHGDYALDNPTDEVLPWRESRLRPLYRTGGERTYELAML